MKKFLLLPVAIFFILFIFPVNISYSAGEACQMCPKTASCNQSGATYCGRSYCDQLLTPGYNCTYHSWDCTGTGSKTCTSAKYPHAWSASCSTSCPGLEPTAVPTTRPTAVPTTRPTTPPGTPAPTSPPPTSTTAPTPTRGVLTCYPDGALCNPLTALRCCSTTFRCVTDGSVDETTRTYEYHCTSIAGSVSSTNQCSSGSCDTAIGNVTIDPANPFAGLAKTLLSALLSLSGGLAVLLIIYSGYILITSQANPERTKQARDQLTAAVVGLLFIIFSIVLLEFVGIDILGLPGFRR